MSQKNNFDLSDFFPITSEKWGNKIVEELKTDSAKNIKWTAGNLSLKPFYTLEDAQNLTYLDNFHSYFALKSPRHWYTREVIQVKEFEKANKQAISLLEKGADAITFQIDKENISEYQLSLLLENIPFHFSPVHFYTNISPLSLIEAFRSLGYFELKGSLKSPSLENFLRKKNPEKIDFAELASAIYLSKEVPRYKLLSIDSTLFHQSDDAVKEIAFSVSLALDYIDKLTENNIEIKDVLSNFEFSFLIGKNYFLEIAKLRAFRFVWNKITEACEIKFDSFSTPLHCITSGQSFSNEDPYQNILYNTTEAMAAIIGGCDSLTIAPFEERNPDFSSRISRNISLILKEEAYFDKTVDPSAGSYFIEKLTDDLIEKSWTLISEIEKQGGFFKSNFEF